VDEVVIGSGQSGDWQCSKWCLTIVKVVVDGGDRFFFFMVVRVIFKGG